MIFLNASEHVYNVHLSEVLYLRNYSQRLGYRFSSRIGGCESLRDIQQAKLLRADCIECSMVESLFAFTKLYHALLSVFIESNDCLPDLHLLIETTQSAAVLPEIIEWANAQDYSINIVPIFDRRKLLKSIIGFYSEDFEVEEYDHQISCFITTALDTLEIKYGISGGINNDCLSKILCPESSVTFIKLGLFSINLDSDLMRLDSSALNSLVYNLQLKEASILNSLATTMQTKQSLISLRQSHLMRYIHSALI